MSGAAVGLMDDLLGRLRGTVVGRELAAADGLRATRTAQAAELSALRLAPRLDPGMARALEDGARRISALRTELARAIRAHRVVQRRGDVGMDQRRRRIERLEQQLRNSADPRLSHCWFDLGELLAHVRGHGLGTGEADELNILRVGGVAGDGRGVAFARLQTLEQAAALEPAIEDFTRCIGAARARIRELQLQPDLDVAAAITEVIAGIGSPPCSCAPRVVVPSLPELVDGGRGL